MNAGGGTFEAAQDAGVVTVAPSEKGEPNEQKMAPAADAGAGVTSSDGPVGPGGMTAAVPRSCADLAAGGAPDQLVDLTWQDQTGTCQSSACWTFIWIKDGCTLEVQRNDLQKTFAMSAADCAAARGWATNARFLDVIRNGTGCAGGNTPESFELTLLQDAPRRKTWGCDEPAVDLERQCLGALADRLYPP
jgi:hypothetical protein